MNTRTKKEKEDMCALPTCVVHMTQQLSSWPLCSYLRGKRLLAFKVLHCRQQSCRAKEQVRENEQERNGPMSPVISLRSFNSLRGNLSLCAFPSSNIQIMSIVWSHSPFHELSTRVSRLNTLIILSFIAHGIVA